MDNAREVLDNPVLEVGGSFQTLSNPIPGAHSMSTAPSLKVTTVHHCTPLNVIPHTRRKHGPKFQVSSFKFQVASFKFQVPSSKCLALIPRASCATYVTLGEMNDQLQRFGLTS